MDVAMHERLRAANRRAARASTLALGLMLVAGFAGAWLIALVMDASLGLPVWGRAAVLLGLLGLAGLGAVQLKRRLDRWRFDARKTAVAVQQQCEVRHSLLINALDLDGQPAAGNAASAKLREAAIAAGLAQATTIEPDVLVDREATRRGWLTFAAAGLVALALMALMPRLFTAGLPRLLVPWADLPAYTSLKFDIHTDPAQVIYGDDVAITATITGGDELTGAALVLQHPDGSAERIGMAQVAAAGTQQTGPAQFRTRLRDVQHGFAFYVDTQAGRSRSRQVEVLPAPSLTAATATYTFPSYTGWPSKRHAVGESGIRALTGTQVEVAIEANLPLQGASLELLPPEPDKDGNLPDPSKAGPLIGSPQTVALTPDSTNPKRATGTFVLDKTGRFRLSLTGADGTPGRDTREGPLVAKPDEKPKVDIADPLPITMAVEGWDVPIRIDAGDDVAIGSVTVHYSVNDTAASAMRLRLPKDDDGRFVMLEETLKVANLKAGPGDVIKFYAVARDRHPSTEHFTETPVHQIFVVSKEEYEKLAREQYQIDDLMKEWDALDAQLDAMQARREAALKEANELMEKLASGEPLSDLDRHRMQQLDSELKKLEQEMVDLAMEMRDRAEDVPLYEFEKPYQEMLREMSAAMQGQAGAAGAVRRSLQAASKQETPSAEELEKLRKRLADWEQRDKPFDTETSEQRDLAEQDLRRIEQADNLMMLAEELASIVNEQRELATKLQSLQGRQDLTPQEQARLEQLARQQQDLADRLNQACTQIDEQTQETAESLPRMSSSLRGLAAEMRRMNVGVDQQTAANAASASQPGQAYASAKAASDKLQSLLQDASNVQGDMAGDLDSCVTLTRQSIQDMMSQMTQGRAGRRAGGRMGAGRSGQTMGQMQKFSVVGPRNSRSDSGEPSRFGGEERGKGGGPGDPDRDSAGEVESIDPTGAASRGGSGFAASLGVPAEYRDDAAAYFQRLADDARTEEEAE